MKRLVFVPLTPPQDRWVSVEDGTVRDLDDKVLGYVGRLDRDWSYRPHDAVATEPRHPTEAAAIAGLLTDPRCPTAGPNRYDR